MPALSNLLGALSVGVGDRQNIAMVQAAALDLTALVALLAVYAHPGCSVGDVAKVVCVTHSGAVRTVDRLLSLGQVERQTNVEDRRAVALLCTQKGTVTAQHALAARQAVLDELLVNALGGELERATAKDIFERLLTALYPETRIDAWRICRLCEHAVCRGDDCPVGRAVV